MTIGFHSGKVICDAVGSCVWWSGWRGEVGAEAELEQVKREWEERNCGQVVSKKKKKM